jgi:hypothetical protein
MANNALESAVRHRGRLVVAMDGVLGRGQWRSYPAARLGG